MKVTELAAMLVSCNLVHPDAVNDAEAYDEGRTYERICDLWDKLHRQETGLLRLVSDIRAAVGDPKGRLMQDELIEHCRKLAGNGGAHRRLGLTVASAACGGQAQSAVERHGCAARNATGKQAAERSERRHCADAKRPRNKEISERPPAQDLPQAGMPVSHSESSNPQSAIPNPQSP